MTVRLLLFGSPTVEYAGESVALPFERRNQLLAFLALKRTWVGRAELAAMLWPEQESKLAYANLRKTLHRLQALPWASGIETQGGAIRFEAETDVFNFESALREQRFADAPALRRGELLAGFDLDQSEAWLSWLNFERDRLRTAWRSALLTRMSTDIDPAEAIDLSARLLESDPLDEAALQAHMSSLARDGQAARARQAYREFVRRLADDLGLEPGATLKALHDSLGTPTAVPVVAAPPRDDSFVGRTVELRRIASRLAQEDCSLLTITGPGGTGKTRLAQRALHELAPSYADGGVFIPLEDVAEASKLGARLARELGVTLSGRKEPLDQVIEFLRERHVLLVLDNFEQLVGGAPQVEMLIQSCQRLKILITSRVRLAISMEWILPLEGLPCPEIEDQDRLEAFDAARLFIRAAQRVEPGLVPSVEAASIVEICRQVEGLPLALELAAAWTRVLSCDAIAEELRKGTELLRTADAAQPARHASMEIVFDQSWRLLSPVERAALARLSVFGGGFTPEAARAIADASLPVLGALVDKSLLRKDGARVFLHPLLHQLAALRLPEGEARESTERAHARYYHRLLANLRRAIEAGNREALQQVETEFENCRLAWHWAVAHQANEMLGPSAPSLLSFSEHRGRFEEGTALLTHALESKSAAEPKLKAQLLAEISQLHFRMDRYTEALAIAEQAHNVAKLARDPETYALCYQVLGMCYLRLARHVEAKRYLQQALQHAVAADEPRKAASILHNLALLEKLMGNRDDALRLFLESLAREKGMGDFVGEAMCLSNIGLVYAEKGELSSAVAHLRDALAISERHGLLNMRMLILAHLTAIAVKMNELALAETYGNSALEIAESTGNRYTVSHIKLSFLRLALQRGDTQLARACLEESLRLAGGIGRPALLFEAVSCFAEILAAEGETDCARLVLTFVMNHPLAHAPARDEARARMAQWAARPDAQMAWPGMDFDELVHRMLIEADTAHASLVANLRGELVH